MTETSVTDTPFYNDCIVLLKRCRKGCAALDGEDDSLAIVIFFSVIYFIPLSILLKVENIYWASDLKETVFSSKAVVFPDLFL